MRLRSDVPVRSDRPMRPANHSVGVRVAGRPPLRRSVVQTFGGGIYNSFRTFIHMLVTSSPNEWPGNEKKTFAQIIVIIHDAEIRKLALYINSPIQPPLTVRPHMQRRGTLTDVFETRHVLSSVQSTYLIPNTLMPSPTASSRYTSGTGCSSASTQSACCGPPSPPAPGPFSCRPRHTSGSRTWPRRSPSPRTSPAWQTVAAHLVSKPHLRRTKTFQKSKNEKKEKENSPSSPNTDAARSPIR